MSTVTSAHVASATTFNSMQRSRFLALALLMLIGHGCFIDDGRGDPEISASGATVGSTQTATVSSSVDATSDSTTEGGSGTATTDDSTSSSPTGTSGTSDDPTTGTDTNDKCDYPAANCDGDPSADCETNLDTDMQHCGSCNNLCDGFCLAGNCVDGRLVFVTSLRHPGNFGGLEEADDVCATAAENANLAGTYLAWLSDESDGPASRFTQAGPPYFLTNGQLLAMNWEDLTDGPLEHPLVIDEQGQEINLVDSCNATQVWTNTTAGGEAVGGNSCEGWADSEGSGHRGEPLFTTDRWTASKCPAVSCSIPQHLYCFQQ